MKHAHWFLVTSDLGGLVRVNVHTADKGTDVDTPLADFTAAEQRTLRAAFAIAAARAGASADAIALPTPATTKTVKRPARSIARRGR